MTPLPGDVTFDRRAAYLGSADALVVADVHLGRDEHSDVRLPLGERADVVDRIDALLDRFDPAEVVVAGDLLHPFGEVRPRIAAATEAFAAAVADAGASLVVTPGNHDAMLEAAFDGPAPAEHRLRDGTVVCHGHDLPDADAGRYVLGHDHPAITIQGRKHPCFLYGGGVVDGSDLLVLPAFNRLARGTVVDDLRGRDVMSPLLAGCLDRCRPVVYDEDATEALAFPPLSALREHL